MNNNTEILRPEYLFNTTKEERTVNLDDYVNVTLILYKCEFYQFVFGVFSFFVYFPIKHYRLYAIAS